jgi:hypothetical protein
MNCDPEKYYVILMSYDEDNAFRFYITGWWCKQSIFFLIDKIIFNLNFMLRKSNYKEIVDANKG